MWRNYRRLQNSTLTLEWNSAHVGGWVSRFSVQEMDQRSAELRSRFVGLALSRSEQIIRNRSGTPKCRAIDADGSGDRSGGRAQTSWRGDGRDGTEVAYGSKRASIAPSIEDLKMLEDWLANSTGPLLLLSPFGSGKSVLLATFACQLAEAVVGWCDNPGDESLPPVPLPVRLRHGTGTHGRNLVPTFAVVAWTYWT